MADHIRQQIREQVASDLTGLTTTSSRVYQSRVYPLADNNLPGLLIYTKDESSEPVTIGTTRILDRNLSLMIQAYCEAAIGFDDTVDDICKEVETDLGGTRTLGGLSKDLYLTSTEIEYDVSGAKPVGYVSMIYTCEYMTDEDAPDVAV